MVTETTTTNNSQNGTKHKRLQESMKKYYKEYGIDTTGISVRLPAELEERVRVIAASNRTSLQGMIREYLQKVVETGEINPYLSGEIKTIVKEVPVVKEIPVKARKMDDTLRTAYGLVVQDIISNLV